MADQAVQSVWGQIHDGAQGLFCDGVSLTEIADRFATPTYVYSAAHILRQYQAYVADFEAHQVAVHYAVKANSNLSILRLLAEVGAGFDIVSAGELARVLRAGGLPEKIVFSGVAKTDDELREALRVGIGCFNVESRGELHRLAALAEEMGIEARIAVRVNPDVDPQTHPYISTGLRENKFGIAMDEALSVYREAAQLPALRIIGISCHIGSQITQLQPFLDAFESVLALADQLTEMGIALQHVDIGGGLGITTPEQDQPYTPGDLVRALRSLLATRDYVLHLEPGRSLVGNAGFLLTRVVETKEQSGHHFVMLDAGMNDYIRPALYQVRPAFRNVSRQDGVEVRSEIVGPVCETGDTFARSYPLSAQRGDLLVMAGAGAYGMAMSSDYNSRPKAAEVLVVDGDARLIRRRQTVTELFAQEAELL